MGWNPEVLTRAGYLLIDPRAPRLVRVRDHALHPAEIRQTLSELIEHYLGQILVIMP